MEFYEITSFVGSMKKIEKFLSELAARDSELRYAGIGRARLWTSYKEAETSFEGFDRNLYELVRLSKFVDRGLSERIEKLANSAELAEGIAHISVSIRIAELRHNTAIAVRKAATTAFDVLLGFAQAFVPGSASRREGFVAFHSDLSLSKILVALSRLIPLAEDVSDKHYRRSLSDDELFKPSNVNTESIGTYIQDAVVIISGSPELGPETKQRLLQYLHEIKTELASESPRWKKIVGGLVIVSTILSGLAVAPQAVQNVQKAVTEILGTAAEKFYPRDLLRQEGGQPKLTTT